MFKVELADTIQVQLRDHPIYSDTKMTGELTIIKQGVTLLQGENGVGKSTLFNQIFNSILEQGKQLIPAYLNQCYNFPLESYPLQAVNDFFFANYTNQLAAKAEFSKLTQQLELELDWGQLSYRHLSGGQRQVYRLIWTLLNKSRLLMLDEPFQYFDQHKKELVVKVLTNIARERALLVIDHEDVVQWKGATINRYLLVKEKDQVWIQS